MSETKGLLKRNFRAMLLLVFLAAAVYLIARNIGVFGNVILVLLGFGGVVIVHEFGHFIVAKLGGIKVEAFSIFMPPTLLGIQRTEQGIRFRVLPRLFAKEDDESDDGGLKFTVGKAGKAGETEYRVGLIPFGGFVKMLGQDDTGPIKDSDDPRSYANKPVGTRMAVISAGVLFNAISALIVFMVVFLVGIELLPPVVGGVVPDSPAAQAGLKAGDEIIEIDGKSNDLDFSNILVAAALSGRDEEVKLKVKRGDKIIDFAIVSEQKEGDQIRRFGVWPPMSLTIAKVSDPNVLLEKTGLLPGDRIRAVNGRDVQAHWELEQIVRDSLSAEVTVLAERTDPVSKENKLVESRIPLGLSHVRNPYKDVESDSDLGHVCSMVPRFRITRVARKRVSVCTRFLSLFKKTGAGKGSVDGGATLKPDDIVLAIGDVENPTYREYREVVTEYKELRDFVTRYKYKPLRDLLMNYKEKELGSMAEHKQLHGLVTRYEVMHNLVTEYEETKLRDFVTKYKDRKLSIKVLRKGPNGLEETLTTAVVPWIPKGSERPVIIGVTLDAEHPVVAKTITVEDGPAALAIPPGAVITAVDGVEVSDFYDIIREIRTSSRRPVGIDYRLDEEVAGHVVLDVGDADDSITVRSGFAERVPIKELKRLYKASGPIDAVVIGYRKTIMFIAQTYVTLRRLVTGLVSPRSLMGPVGILAISYTVVTDQPPTYYAYLLALISASIAVINFLPLPPFDGGHIVLLAIEKVKGSALSERIQGAVAYAGVVFVVALFIYLTFNDILNMLFR